MSRWVLTKEVQCCGAGIMHNCTTTGFLGLATFQREVQIKPCLQCDLRGWRRVCLTSNSPGSLLLAYFQVFSIDELSLNLFIVARLLAPYCKLFKIDDHNR